MNGGVLTAPMSQTRLAVLELLLSTNSLDEIAKELGISRQAVCRQVNICKKFELVSGPFNTRRPRWHVEPLGQALLHAVKLLQSANSMGSVILTPLEAQSLLLLISKA